MTALSHRARSRAIIASSAVTSDSGPVVGTVGAVGAVLALAPPPLLVAFAPPAGSMSIVTFVPAGGITSALRSHRSVSFELLARSGISIIVRSKFTTLTTYPVTSAAYLPSPITREPEKIHVSGGIGFLVRMSRIHRYAGIDVRLPSCSYSIVICSGGPCGGSHVFV